MEQKKTMLSGIKPSGDLTLDPTWGRCATGRR